MSDQPAIEQRPGEGPRLEMRSAARRSSRLVNLLVLLVAAVAGLTICETAVRVFHLFAPQRAAARMRTTAPESMATALGPATGDAPFSRWIVHPYRGMTPRPLIEAEDSRTNVFGILSSVEDPRRLPEEEYVVGIFGGSVARSTALQEGHRLEAMLTAARAPGDSPVRVVNFAVSGYKQPQQAFLLAELLLLGTPLDAVVNLDGYNEVALGASDANFGHHPLYPHHDFWTSAFGSAAGTLSAAQIELAARALAQRRRADALRQRAEQTPVLRRFRLFRALVGFLVMRAEAAAVLTEEEMRRLPTRTPDADLFRLADPCLDQEFQCWDLIIGLWVKSSRMMKALADEAGAEYFHVLQPNMYLAGSKQLSSEEREKFWRPDWLWSRAAARGYPLLREAGHTLRASGIRFYDLTQVFADRPETIYRDMCCHYSPEGYAILATEMGRRMGEALAAQKPEKE